MADGILNIEDKFTFSILINGQDLKASLPGKINASVLWNHPSQTVFIIPYKDFFHQNKLGLNGIGTEPL